MEIDPAVIRGWLEVARAIDQQLRVLAEKAAPFLTALAQFDWAALKQRVEELPEKSKAVMALAASRGWFFGWNDSLQGVMELVQKLEAANPSAVDDVMVEYYRANLQPFTDELVSNHPHRAAVIKAAVRAHTTLGDDGYFLSIPVFIAQADGLLAEITKVRSALMRDGGRPELQASRALRDMVGADQEALDLIDQLLNLHNLDFMKSAAARQMLEEDSGEAFIALNRHQVMHGESYDYGTEVNSLKAFSFLVHVGAHLPMVLKQDT